ncbi:hemagglutinin repeat-containing protein [Pantoea agglomerans]
MTDERFTSQSKFISSDYLLERVGYDPSQVHKRLGDGFYEQRLVREQVLKLTGRPSVNGWDAMAQYQELMNNGSKVAQDFHLVPGVALTPQQIAALQQDIVWLVSETVDTADGPQTVWVPKVYLAQTTLRLTGAGAVIGGGTLQLSADSVTNAGNLFADQALSIDSGKFQHLGGAQGVTLVAGKDMNLTGDSVTIDPGFDSRSRKETFEQKQSGLSIALSGTAGSALNTAVSSAQQARKSGDGRVSALQNTQAALNGVQAAQAAQMDGLNTAAADAHNAAGDLKPGQDGYQAGSTNTIGVSASYGSQSSKSEARTESSQSQGSTLMAGRNLTVTATGKNGTAQSGDISIAGSQLKAGGDLGLDASRDILLQSAQNTQSTDSKNSSKGGSVGVGIGVGSGGYGISVSASVNAAKGSEKGNGLTHSETTLDAGNRLSLTSGRDITLTGAQASGESVKVDAGRNLTLTSEQDSDRYDSKQQSASAGGSFTFGSMTGSANVNVSRDKMHSNWQSVAEQTGIFAGKGGFDVTVGEHTQLNGAVIASTADASLNKLDTGTLGFGDIENHAEYEVEHQSAGMSTGGSIGGQFAGNMANGMLAGLNGSGSADSTTKAAVSEVTIVIRDKEKQAQDVAGLSRDVANANPGLDVIFDKEKEQNRLKAAQLIGEIGAQAGDIARTQGEIIATRAANEKMSGATQTDRDRALAELKAQDPTKQYSASDVNKQVYSNYYNQAFAESGFGTGGKMQQAISAVTAAVQGLSGGNVAQAISGASAPYLAEKIHELTTDANGKVNTEANLMAHAVLGAVTSYAAGNAALAGASGAVMGEYIAQQLYPGVKRSDLSEEQRQTISALGTLAAGLAGGVVGDSTADVVAGAQAGKNALEFNSLSGDKARETAKQVAESLKSQVREKLGEGTTSSIANGIINALADTGDAALGGADYGADAAMALTSCAMGDSYCTQALSDLSGKNQAAADTLKALMKSEAWTAVAGQVKEAAQGNQLALEATGGMLAGLFLPGKKIPDALAIQTISNSVVDAKKFDYLFGRSTGNPHTLDRTNQLSLEMKRLGVTDDVSGHAMLAEHFTTATKNPSNIVKKYTDQYGSFEVRESFFMGPSGKATMFESTFEVMSNGSHRFITTIPKNGATQ